MARGIWNILTTVCQNQIGVLLKDEVKDIQGSLELLLSALAEETETTHRVDEIPSIIKEQSFTYDAELDKICFIIDRDRKSFIYPKSKYDSEELLRRIDKAVVNEKQFCEDDIELEHSVGSKVGMLVEELRK